MRPTLYAVLSDIHANYQALLAVEADARRVSRSLDAQKLNFIVLGDVVDYGPQPNQCMDWVRDHARIVVRGNHDWDAASSLYRPPSFIGSRYWPITIWTRRILRRDHKKRISQPDGSRWQPDLCKRNADLPGALESFMLFHSSLVSGHHGYIDDTSKAWRNIQRLGDGITYGLFGHTHVQGYFVDDPLRKRDSGDKTTTMYLTLPETTNLGSLGDAIRWEPVVMRSSSDDKGVGETPWIDLPSQSALFNPGGLGQPRFHAHARIYAPRDNRASYLLLKSNGQMQVQFRRVPYDYEETIRRLREEVTWSVGPCTRGSDILKEVDGPNPLPPEAWDTLMLYYRQFLNDMPRLLPELIENVLIPQLR